MLALLRRFGPLLVAAAALALAVRGIDFDKLAAATRGAPLIPLIGVSAIAALVNCAADTLAMYYVFRWFGLHLRYIDLYTIRAATYTLAVVNYHAGQAGIIGYIHRVGRVSLSRASAYILFIIGVWVALLLIFAGGSLLLGGDKARALAPVLLAFFAGLLIYLVLITWPPRFLLHAPPRSEAADGVDRWTRLRNRLWRVLANLWAPLHQAGALGHLRALLVRVPHLLVLLCWHYFALRCFRIEVPPLAAILYLPVVFAIASLPISVQGLGTSQIAAKYFFAEYAASGGEAVLAYSLTMTAISTATNLGMGLLFLGRGARLGLRDMAESASRGLADSDSQPAT